MSKYTVKRCIRPQCMEIYPEDTRNKYCDCGALLQRMEIDSFPWKSNKKLVENTNKGTGCSIKTEIKEDGDKTAYLYLLLDDGKEITYELGKTTSIGRTVDSNYVDIDLKQYGGNRISRRHAVISREAGGYYITNLSQNHSVHINEKVLAYGKKELLKTQDAVILSRKYLLEFEEGE